MNKLFFILPLSFVTTLVLGQKIQYSRQTFPSPYADAVQLIAGVKGTHHVVCFTANKKPLLYVFDAAMQTCIKKELDVKIRENCDVRTVSFGDHYLLYLHVPGTTQHQLFDVQSGGEAEDISALFSNRADTAWNRSMATFQLFNQSGRLAVVTHAYYEAIKMIGSRVVVFDSALATSQVHTVFFAFDKEVDYLSQIVLSGNALLMLKAVKNPESGNSLDVLKADLTSGKILGHSFNSGSHLYISPAMHFNASDSTLLIYSLLREPVNASRLQRSVFIAHLDHQLQSKTPSSLLKSQFRSNTAASFLLVNGPQPRWLSTMNTVRIRKAGSRYAMPTGLEMDDPANLNIAAAQNYSYEPGIEYNTPTAVHFTVLNERFKPVKDSVVANGGNVYDVQPRPYAQFALGQKAYLLLIENFSASKRGLLLLTGNEKSGLSSTSLPVFDRYEYMVPQVQGLNDCFILPYVYKNEVGLIKITPTN